MLLLDFSTNRLQLRSFHLNIVNVANVLVKFEPEYLLIIMNSDVNCVRLTLLWVIVCSLNSFVCGDFKGFDDTVLFKINWPGRDSTELLVSCR